MYLTILGIFGFVLNGFMVFLYLKQKKVTRLLKMKGNHYKSVFSCEKEKISTQKNEENYILVEDRV